MAEEYVPVNFGEEEQAENPNSAPGKNATATTSSSVASSSRVASAASAPVRLGNASNRTMSERITAAYVDQPTAFAASSKNIMMQQQSIRSGIRSGTATPIHSGAATPAGGNSINSSPLIWNSNTPQRNKSRREFEQKIRHRRGARANAPPNFPTDLNFPDTTAEGKNRRKSADDSKNTATTDQSATLPLPKALTDILLQTAMLGVGTTAKLSKPTLEITKNTLLPQLIIPLFKEIWEEYAPARFQTWLKVVPTSLHNVMNLLCDTEAGQSLGQKAGRLGENVVDMASSEVARQCWIDVTVSLIKLMEGLHTPEVKALLDQFAVGMCRFVDVLSSGKAKQVWFDVSEALWALIEVGADPVMVMSLAEGCAQICFALERERESLKRRRKKAGELDAKLDRLAAAEKRRERDRRQAGTYPPGTAVVREGGGRDGFQEALLDGLEGINDNPKQNIGEFEGRLYDNMKDGPPQRVIVPTSSTENMQLNQADGIQNEATNNNVVVDDDASEITTDIEDLRRGDGQVDYDDVQTQSSASEKQQGKDSSLAYEQEENAERMGRQQNQDDDLNLHDDGTASEMYDNFDEPILQFYRRLNEVLVETRKQAKLDLHHENRVGKPAKDKEKVAGDDSRAPDFEAGKDISSSAKPLVSKGIFGIQKKWWKLFIVASICGVVAMCSLWFALGCYGFYVIFLGGERTVQYHPSQPMVSNQQPIVIQVVASKSTQAGECNASTDNEKDGVATISLDEWNQVKLDVDTIIENQIDLNDGHN